MDNVYATQATEWGPWREDPEQRPAGTQDSQATWGLCRCQFTRECKGTGLAEGLWGPMNSPVKQISTMRRLLPICSRNSSVDIHKGIDLYFFSFVTTLVGFGIRVIRTSWTQLGAFRCLLLAGGVSTGSASKLVQPFGPGVLREASNYRFNFFHSYRIIHVYHCFWDQLW